MGVLNRTISRTPYFFMHTDLPIWVLQISLDIRILITLVNVLQHEPVIAKINLQLRQTSYCRRASRTQLCFVRKWGKCKIWLWWEDVGVPRLISFFKTGLFSADSDPRRQLNESLTLSGTLKGAVDWCKLAILSGSKSQSAMEWGLKISGIRNWGMYL